MARRSTDRISVRVQTPQAFRFQALVEAYDQWTGASPTDESTVMRAAGHEVAVVEGDPMLDKLTTAADLARAEAWTQSQLVPRTGLGFDVHAFAGDGPLMMGGIAIPHDRGLAGHSDADVVLHSITDALLGRGRAWRYRPAFSAQRSPVEGRGQQHLPCPRRRSRASRRRDDRLRRLHRDLRGAQGRPASRRHAIAGSRDIGNCAGVGQHQGNDHRAAWASPAGGEGIAAQAVANVRVPPSRPAP